MKHGIGLLLGLVVGVAAGLVVLYYNPLTAERERPAPEAALRFGYELPIRSALALVHRGQLDLPAIPDGVPTLWERPIDDVVLGVIALTDEHGETAAIASRVSLPSTSTDPLLSGLLVTDYWLVSVPGQGSLAIEAESNLWPFVKDTFLPVTLLGRPWRGPAVYRPTSGPHAGLADVYGASGRFKGLRGTAVEALDLEGFSRGRGIEALDGELVVAFAEPQAEHGGPQPVVAVDSDAPADEQARP